MNTIINLGLAIGVLIAVGYGMLAIAAFYHFRNYRYITKGPEKDVNSNATECVGKVS